jgi:AhpD family alkylhydroperoxidase
LTGNYASTQMPETEDGMQLKDTQHRFAAERREDPRRASTPETFDAFKDFCAHAFAAGALSEKTKELIALACAHVTQSPGCIQGHAKRALRAGATRQEMMEAIWVAAALRSGGAYQHAKLAIAIADEQETASQIRSTAPSRGL